MCFARAGMAECQNNPSAPLQDELDELERLLLREYAQDEVTRTISTSCQNLTDTSSPKSSGPKLAGFAKNFGQRILDDQRKKEHKKTLLKRFTENFTTKVAAERSDMLNRAAIIAQGCGSPMMINNRKKLLKAFVLHIAARILTEQKRVIEKAREAKEGSVHGRVVKMNKLNAALTQEFVKKYMNREPTGASSPHTRSRCYSDHGSVYDLSQFAYPGKGSSKRLFSRPLQRISPEPGPFNPLNVQRMPYSPLFRAKSASPERISEQKGAKYRFPGIKRYASLKKGNLIDLDNN